MRSLSAFLLTSLLAPLASHASPLSAQETFSLKGNPRPLVIWHGLGDTALSEGISSFIEDIKSVHPGIFVYSVKVPLEGSLDDEKKAGFWGNSEAQGTEGCEQLALIPELKDGFDAMGFSQGGLFLRNYAQFCNDPPIKNLMTVNTLLPFSAAAADPALYQFGTPHFGIASLIPCPTPPSLTCLLAARAARSGIYSEWAQTHLVQATYFRDPARLEEFWEKNTFIRDLNAEGIDGLGPNPASEGERENGGLGLGKLENLIAVTFDADRTVSPALSAHFATYSPENKTLLIELKDQPLYKEDWIGLRALDEKGRLQLEHCPGEHMDLGGGCADRIVKEWVGWKN
ncbi:palmitoyl-protein thioesterase, partial [Tremellales sp. Uapishka_1]